MLQTTNSLYGPIFLKLSDKWSKSVFCKKYPKVVLTIEIENEANIAEVYTLL